MKPCKLTLSGWGPYREKEQIDFDRIAGEGLFLITGPTGGGKTTIFDGITYALFGEVSGSIREKESLRSDFAPGEVSTYVTLEFEEKGKSYRLTRNPKYERLKLRGEGTTTEPEGAELTCEGEVIALGGQAVTEKIKEILGLDYHQFKQLSMIAQGEFQQLLTAPSKERTNIFRNIFKTRIYDTITGILSLRTKDLMAQIQEKKSRAEEVSGIFSCEDSDWIELMEKKNKNWEKIENLAVKKQEAQKDNLEILDKDLKKVEKNYKESLLNLEKSRSENQAIRQFLELRQRYEAMIVTSQEIEAELQLLKQSYDKLPVMKSQVEARKHEKTKLEEKRERLCQWKEQMELLRKAQLIYLDLDKKAKEKKANYEQMEDMAKKAAAGLLAMELEEGNPCPVCGSLNHPNKARLQEGTPDEAALKRSKAEYEAAWEKAAQAQSQAVSEKTTLSIIEKQLPDIHEEGMADQLLNQLNEEYRQAVQWIEKTEKEILETEQGYQTASLKKERAVSALEQMKASMVMPDTLEEKDLLEMTGKIEALEVEKKEKLRHRERLFTNMESNRKALSAVKKLRKEKEELEYTYGYLREIERAASGYNQKNLILEQYVLSVYFDEILQAANQRLSAMSGGRYQLCRVLETRDKRGREAMELEVFDQYTGKKRSVKSLSGGESFHAALALALGSSDVIQSYAGGIWVETLFVDEGFGSLDSESLGQALDILTGLCGGSRLIGIISHVEELKERIGNQILVVKTNSGSRIMTKNVI